MKQWELGYLAAMVDAECHIGIQREIGQRRKNPAYTIRFELAMTDRGPIDFVNSLLPSAKRVSVAAKGRRTAYYRLRLVKHEALRLLRSVRPFVQGKGRQIDLCMKMEKLRSSYSPAKAHFGKACFQPMPKAFARRAEPVFAEFRSLQLKKGRHK